MHMKTPDPNLSHFDIIGRFVPETLIIILVSLTQKYCLHVCPNLAHFENFVPEKPFPTRPTPYLQVRRRPTSSRWCAQGGGTRTSPRRDPTSSSTSPSSTRYVGTRKITRSPTVLHYKCRLRCSLRSQLPIYKYCRKPGTTV